MQTTSSRKKAQHSTGRISELMMQYFIGCQTHHISDYTMIFEKSANYDILAHDRNTEILLVKCPVNLMYRTLSGNLAFLPVQASTSRTLNSTESIK